MGTTTKKAAPRSRRGAKKPAEQPTVAAESTTTTEPSPLDEPIADLESSGGKGKGKAKDGSRTFMHEQREKDAKDAKLGQAASHVKEAHGLALELFTRLRTARLATATHEAIRHDLQRVVDLCQDVEDSASKALRKLPL